jgi:threonine/homoserine/homoserine lactone efflux protein
MEAGQERSMTMSALALYAAVYFAAVATPGPGVAALVARVLGHGLRGVAPFILGFVVGDLVWLSIAATGLSIVAHSFTAAFFVLKILGAIYLLYVAWGLARKKGALDPSAALREPPTGARAFLGALSLTLSNPKVIVFFLSIMPLAVDLSSLTPARFAALGAVSVLVLGATLFTYALAAHQTRNWMRSTRATSLARKTAAGIMAGVAVAIVTR